MQPNRRHIYKTVRGHWFKRSPARCLRPSSWLTGTMNGKTAVPVANTQQLKMLGTMNGKTTMPGSRAGTGPKWHHKDGPKGPQSPTRGKCQVQRLQQMQRQHQHRLHNFRQFRDTQRLGSRWALMNTSRMQPVVQRWLHHRPSRMPLQQWLHHWPRRMPFQLQLQQRLQRWLHHWPSRMPRAGLVCTSSSKGCSSFPTLMK